MGTPDYMAPEQWDSCHRADIRSDLYSLGCTLYSLLTGRPPFSADEYDSNTKKMAAHLRDTAPPVSTLRPGLPKGVAVIVERLLAKDPAARPQTPAALMRELGPFAAGADLKALAGRGASASRPTGGETLSHPPSPVRSGAKPRRLAMLPAVTLLGVIVLAGLGRFFLWPGVDPGNATGSNVVAPTPVVVKHVPGVWRELLDHEPTPLVWPKNDANCRWEYDPLTKGLFVDCTDFAMLQVGECGEKNFEIEATLFQNPWSGHFGVCYFGKTAGENRSAQMIGLEKFLPEHLPNPAGLFRGSLRLSPLTDRAMFNRDTGAKIPTPVARNHQLAFKITGGKLIRAEWDGAPVPDSILRNQSADPAAGDGIGVFVQSTSAWFRSIRLRVTEP